MSWAFLAPLSALSFPQFPAENDGFISEGFVDFIDKFSD